jgi:hypothetical protein
LLQVEVQTRQEHCRTFHQHHKSLQYFVELSSRLDYKGDGIPTLRGWAEDDAGTLCNDASKGLKTETDVVENFTSVLMTPCNGALDAFFE